MPTIGRVSPNSRNDASPIGWSVLWKLARLTLKRIWHISEQNVTALQHELHVYLAAVLVYTENVVANS